MGVYIKGMEMPKNCGECRFNVDGWCYVCVPQSEEERKRITSNYCPLVPVPPHGRLIDADALYKTIDATSERTIGHTTFKETVLLDIRGMPTILESTMGQVNSEKAINEAEEGE